MNKRKLFAVLIAISIPVLYAIALRLFYGITTWRDLFSVMSVSFLFCLPTIAGAYREAVFTNGLVFHETVYEYVDKKKMVFTIKAYPHEIPSATMDEHVVIGGQYFDVLNGTYELEKLQENLYRLHLSSRFKLTTTFNFYAGWWATWIMKDIQNNILQVEKERSETM